MGAQGPWKRVPGTALAKGLTFLKGGSKSPKGTKLGRRNFKKFSRKVKQKVLCQFLKKTGITEFGRVKFEEGNIRLRKPLEPLTTGLEEPLE